MDVKDLRYFVAVYEAEGFSRASRELGTVQSNVSARIRNLESTLAVRRTREKGFTLLELLVVVAIIGLLAGFVAPRYFGQLGKSEIATARAQMDALEKALDQYRLDTGRYPSTELGLKALVERPATEPKWNGPYLRKALPLDPWGKAYSYKLPEHKSDFDLVSYGRDGQPGGTGEDADISNH